MRNPDHPVARSPGGRWSDVRCTAHAIQAAEVAQSSSAGHGSATKSWVSLPWPTTRRSGDEQRAAWSNSPATPHQRSPADLTLLYRRGGLGGRETIGAGELIRSCSWKTPLVLGRSGSASQRPARPASIGSGSTPPGPKQARQDVFSAGWLSDHLSDVSRERGGTAFEAFTTAAALAHRVPGKWIGLAVAANTFRHPAVLAKQATMLDIVTGGRFVLGLGAGWHAGEHEAFGVELPEPRERFRPLRGGTQGCGGTFQCRRHGSRPGSRSTDPLYQLDRATNEPPPVSPNRPPDLAGRPAPAWHGADRCATRQAGRCPATAPATSPTSPRNVTRSAALSRTPGATRTISLLRRRSTAAPMRAHDARRWTWRANSGALAPHHVILGIPGSAAPDALGPMIREVAMPLSETA